LVSAPSSAQVLVTFSSPTAFKTASFPSLSTRRLSMALPRRSNTPRGRGRIGVDLEEQTITSPTGQRHRFEIDPRRRAGLLEGLDEVALTLQRDDEIRAFQAADRAERPWIHFARTSA
jgi:3-isopropylmalate/(R)-2-methylmalate dehydratase small subunit